MVTFHLLGYIKAKQGWAWLKPWMGDQMGSCRSNSPVGGAAQPIVFFLIVEINIEDLTLFQMTNSTYFI
jgi:hypothetical protein